MADEALAHVADYLISEADQVLDKAGIERPSDDKDNNKARIQEIDRIYERFKKVVPAEHCRNVADILNAAWRAYRDSNLWVEIPSVQEKKGLILLELVLKNFEVFEIEQILKESP